MTSFKLSTLLCWLWAQCGGVLGALSPHPQTRVYTVAVAEKSAGDSDEVLSTSKKFLQGRSEENIFVRAEREAEELSSLSAHRGTLENLEKKRAEEMELWRKNVVLNQRNSALERENNELATLLGSEAATADDPWDLSDFPESDAADVLKSAALVGVLGGLSLLVSVCSIFVCWNALVGNSGARVQLCGFDISWGTLINLCILLVLVCAGFWVLWITGVLEDAFAHVIVYLWLIVVLVVLLCVGLMQLQQDMSGITESLGIITQTTEQAETLIFGEKKKAKRPKSFGADMLDKAGDALGIDDEEDSVEDRAGGDLRNYTSFASMSHFSRRVDMTFDHLFGGLNCGGSSSRPQIPKYVTETPEGTVHGSGRIQARGKDVKKSPT